MKCNLFYNIIALICIKSNLCSHNIILLNLITHKINDYNMFESQFISRLKYGYLQYCQYIYYIILVLEDIYILNLYSKGHNLEVILKSFTWQIKVSFRCNLIKENTIKKIKPTFYQKSKYITLYLDFENFKNIYLFICKFL